MLKEARLLEWPPAARDAIQNLPKLEPQESNANSTTKSNSQTGSCKKPQDTPGKDKTTTTMPLTSLRSFYKDTFSHASKRVGKDSQKTGRETGNRHSLPPDRRRSAISPALLTAPGSTLPRPGHVSPYNTKQGAS
ncbi:hypothetical protein BU23DRAFT_573281 [Bimuria novae-zelandiae CBS 107.79]|uniref:Uncharacterized protein n=1 Tax=Bimuria novae-zelandiae CBS 107.79 TaxID=1447943 RepID=A0A6A5URS7_9PLEO|nr:hypothetical protein BU23DRAFT_573281 [Bimuria novae-zelandiae CBS 107.79]